LENAVLSLGIPGIIHRFKGESMTLLRDLLKQAEENEKKIRTKEGFEGVSFDGEWITLDGHYDIKISRAKTKEDLLVWITHMVGKSWVNAKHIYWIIRITSKFHGFNPHINI